MFAPINNHRVYLTFFFLLTLLPALASAKPINFSARNGFAFGFEGGLSPAPTSNSLGSQYTRSSSHSTFYGLEAMLEITPFILVAGDFLVIKSPLESSSGTDSTGNFNESMEGTSIAIDPKLLLIPWISANLRARAYFGGGIGYTHAALVNRRSYLTSSNTVTNTFIEHTSGTASSAYALAGYQMFFVQNYSFNLEFGYRHDLIGGLDYDATNDVQGNPEAKGTSKKVNGQDANYDASGLYASAGILVHF